ncbi:MAG TPA: glycine betaine ABC transporter substrate-binding protein [Actinomycetota bacterium]|jgi:glycine betaine/choline ABC-type transport system substrate-binding protein|nr:glycine betaine ABC transporter substrate-binding protein [Actinomycetota bacterium]
MRRFRNTVHGAALIALLLMLGACGSGVGGDEEEGTGGGGGEGTVAEQLVLGGPPECPERPFCLPGLEETYGIEFEEFQPLDVGGPLTVKAIESGRIDVGLLFSTSSVIGDRGWVVLEDDKSLQTAENITPVVSEEAADDTVESLLNEVSAALDTQTMTELNGRVEIDDEEPADVAADFLAQEGISGDGAGGSGKITVGSVQFAENQIVAEMYATVLREAGYDVSRKDVGSREVLQPALESGEVDVAPEYLGSLLLFLDPDAEATGDPENNRELLEPLLAESSQVLLESSDANDTNAFVVTQETADEFGLTTMSDLAQPAE